MSKLKNKVIIVTGGSGLIGQAIINHIKSESGTAINFDINTETDLNIDQIRTDITDEKSIDESLALVIKNYNQINGLVNNAYPRTKDWGNQFEDVEYSSWNKNMEMQLGSVFLISKKVLKHFTNHNEGSIVNIASIYGVVGNNFNVYNGTNLTSPVAYSAIKGGLINLTKYLASYYGHQNIRVNCVSPGGVFDDQDAVFVENYKKIVPMKRMGLPEDIAPSVSFLLSEEASYITGQNLIVDGGWTCI
jgi:NAD(P)-dependent dehydrogenase (short-subunit alcohol dehydrogenase family)